KISPHINNRQRLCPLTNTQEPTHYKQLNPPLLHCNPCGWTVKLVSGCPLDQT
ncbi:hypothetical protein LEMLEM_LOCUS11752, partial [Lemmus lemmus]